MNILQMQRRTGMLFSLPIKPNNFNCTRKKSNVGPSLNDLQDARTAIEQSDLAGKIQLLKTKHADTVPFFTFLYSSARFGVTSKSILKEMEKRSKDNSQTSKAKPKTKKTVAETTNYNDIFPLLLDLNQGKLKGHQGRDTVIRFINNNEAHQNLILDIVDRSIAGITKKLLVKVEKNETGLMPTPHNDIGKKKRPSRSSVPLSQTDISFTFTTALAKIFKGCSKNFSFTDKSWYASRKVDGVRCICIVKQRKENDFNISFVSRVGNEFSSLDHLKPLICDIARFANWKFPEISHKDFVFDGEVCAMDESLKLTQSRDPDIKVKNADVFGISFRENFQNTMKGIKKKNVIFLGSNYLIFDIIPLSDFSRGFSPLSFSHRVGILNDLRDQFGAIFGNPLEGCVHFLTQKKINKESDFVHLQKQCRKKNWEGLMLREDCAYEGKRTSSLLKVKDFQDAEFKVIGIDTGKMIVFDEKGDREKKEVVTRLNIDYKGQTVGVGSGLSHLQRIQFKENPDLIIGKTVTVKFMSESVNSRTGNVSLRFPTLMFIHEAERTV